MNDRVVRHLTFVCKMERTAIRPLEQGVARHLEVGQVVADVCGVVKELVDNALDAAGTSQVSVIVKHANTYVSVQDNGCGLAEEDLELLCARAATSKYTAAAASTAGHGSVGNCAEATSHPETAKRQVEVIGVNTLGFRGMALHAIAHISSTLKVTTCKESAVPNGLAATFTPLGQLQKKPHRVARERGTTVEVFGLFENWPVRKTHAQTQQKRLAQSVAVLLQNYAVAFPHIRFSLLMESVSLLRTPGRASALDTSSCVPSQGRGVDLDVLAAALASVHGAAILRKMERVAEDLQFDAGESDPNAGSTLQVCQMRGFVSRGHLVGSGTSSGAQQYVVINARPVEYPAIARAITESFRQCNLNNARSFPCFVLHFSVPSEFVDVNVNPGKTRVFISGGKSLLEAIKSVFWRLWHAADSAQIIPRELKSSAGKSQMLLLLQPSGQPSQTRNREPEDEYPEEEKIGEGDNDIVRGGLDRLDACSNTLDGEEDTAFPSVSPQSDGVRAFSCSPEESLSIFPLSMSLTPSGKNDDAKQDIDNSSDHAIESLATEVVASSPMRRTGFSGQCTVHPGVEVDLPKEAPRPRNRNNRIRQAVLNEGAGLTGSKRRAEKDNIAKDSMRHKSASTLDEKHTPSAVASTTTFRRVYAPEQDDDMLLESQLFVRHRLVADAVDATNPEKDDPWQRENDKHVRQIRHDDEFTIMHDIGGVKVSKRRVRASISVSLEKLAEWRKSHHASMLRLRQLDVLSAARAAEQVPRNLENVIEEEKRLSLVFSKARFADLEVIGQFNLGFFLARLGQQVFVIDQHAADEKYNFEKLNVEAAGEGASLALQSLLIPKALSFCPEDLLIVREHLQIIQQAGFQLTTNADSSWRLSAVPVLNGVVFGDGDLFELVQYIREHGIPQEDGQTLSGRALLIRASQRIRAIHASKACRKSIMIGTALKRQTMEQVVSNLSGLQSPWSCPHGRPTMRYLFSL
ncbi:Mismatch repair endonuclease pms1 [Porphyridium purpureum]|uniref:Mismatch repair endonuclease pms1 n=1 Tax=Porphyridium purpureum TaxID=35688 RepID=A0A5J4YZF1_PORPP|nr:Mismatch repair endonuclease pms1 [Porphyridium purpureum]|eukprot:POR8004..scf208_2